MLHSMENGGIFIVSRFICLFFTILSMSDVLIDNMLSNHKFLICLDTPTSVSNERAGGDEGE